MKLKLLMVTAVLVGALLGFFGVLVSVFADGGVLERLITIGIILLIYAALGGLWGFFLPGIWWHGALALSLPGVLLLALYMLGEFNPYYLVYMVLILALAGLGAYGGKALSTGRQ